MTVGGEDESKKNHKTENKSARNYHEIWPFGRLDTSQIR
jgi:hypothetical protein